MLYLDDVMSLKLLINIYNHKVKQPNKQSTSPLILLNFVIFLSLLPHHSSKCLNKLLDFTIQKEYGSILQYINEQLKLTGINSKLQNQSSTAHYVALLHERKLEQKYIPSLLTVASQ